MAPTSRLTAPRWGRCRQHPCAADLPVDAFQWVCAVDLGPVFLGEAHEGQHVSFGTVHQRRELGPPGSGAGRRRLGGRQHRGDGDLLLATAGASQAHEVDQHGARSARRCRYKHAVHLPEIQISLAKSCL